MSVPMTGSATSAETAIPRVSRSPGPVRAKAAPEYATDDSTFKARMPLSHGACASRRYGERDNTTSSVACCTQNPADEMANSRTGETGSWVIAKKGNGPNETFLSPGEA